MKTFHSIPEDSIIFLSGNEVNVISRKCCRLPPLATLRPGVFNIPLKRPKTVVYSKNNFEIITFGREKAWKLLWIIPQRLIYRWLMLWSFSNPFSMFSKENYKVGFYQKNGKCKPGNSKKLVFGIEADDL